MEADWTEWGASDYETLTKVTSSTSAPSTTATSPSSPWFDGAYLDRTDDDQLQYYRDFYRRQASDVEDEDVDEDRDENQDQDEHHSFRNRKRRREKGGRDHARGSSSSGSNSNDRRNDSRDRVNGNNKSHRKFAYGNGDDLIDQVLSWNVGEGI